MEKNGRQNLPSTSFLAAALAPVIAFVLANALFLPFVLAMMDFSNSFLMDLVPVNVPGGGYLFTSLLVLIFPLLAGLVLLGPAAVALIVNLVRPVMTGWSKAFWGGVVFFFSHLILLTVLLLYRHEPLFRNPDPLYPFSSPGSIFFLSFTIDPLPFAGLLSGFALSASVLFFGWLGARIRRKKPLIPR